MTSQDQPARETREQIGVDALFGLVEASAEGVVVIDEQRQIVYLNTAAADIAGYQRDELLGMDVLDLIAPRARGDLEAGIAEALAGRGGARSSAVIRPDGIERLIEYSSVLLSIGGKRHIGAMVRDVTGARRLEREADALVRIANTLTTNQSLDDRLDAIAATVVDSTRAAACAILIISGSPPELVRIRGHNVSDRMIESIRSYWVRAVELDAAAYRAYRTGESKVVPDIYKLTQDRPWGDEYDEPVRSEGWRATIATPIVYRGMSLGTLMAYFPREISVEPVEIDFLRAIANQASVVIENARLFQETRARAVLEERQRLARELHDSVSQALYGIALGARTALTMARQNPARVDEPIEYVLSLAETALAEMRALIFELRPESLEKEGLITATRRQITALERRYDLQIDADLPEEPDIPLRMKEALYRIIQEALLNTAKHANASRVRVRLAVHGDEIIAEVSDNGRGFDPSADFPGHLGLHSMRERTATVRGTTRIESAPGEGTRVVARIPLNGG